MSSGGKLLVHLGALLPGVQNLALQNNLTPSVQVARIVEEFLEARKKSYDLRTPGQRRYEEYRQTTDDITHSWDELPAETKAMWEHNTRFY